MYVFTLRFHTNVVFILMYAFTVRFHTNVCIHASFSYTNNVCIYGSKTNRFLVTYTSSVHYNYLTSHPSICMLNGICSYELIQRTLHFMHIQIPASFYIWASSWENRFVAYAKTKTQISFAVTAKLISAFVFAIRIVQSVYYQNPKFQASFHLLWLFSPVCVGPGRKPRRPVFSQRGSILFPAVGLQHWVISDAEPWGLPLKHTTIAQNFKTLGYATHIVGKVRLCCKFLIATSFLCMHTLSKLDRYANTPMQLYSNLKWLFLYEIFLFLPKKDDWYTLESPHCDGSNEYPQSMF